MRELTEKLLEEITRRLAESIRPERICLFGSYATGNAAADSDVDLLVVVRDTDKSTHQITLGGRKSLRDLLIPLDLIVCTEAQFKRYGQVKNTIMNEALCDGRIVYGS